MVGTMALLLRFQFRKLGSGYGMRMRFGRYYEGDVTVRIDSVAPSNE